MGVSEESLKRQSGRLSLQGVRDLDPNRCRHISVDIVPPVHIWPGANLGFNLTGVVCYCTLPDVGTQWHHTSGGIVAPGVTTFSPIPNQTSWPTCPNWTYRVPTGVRLSNERRDLPDTTPRGIKD